MSFQYVKGQTCIAIYLDVRSELLVSIVSLLLSFQGHQAASEYLLVPGLLKECMWGFQPAETQMSLVMKKIGFLQMRKQRRRSASR